MLNYRNWLFISLIFHIIALSLVSFVDNDPINDNDVTISLEETSSFEEDQEGVEEKQNEENIVIKEIGENEDNNIESSNYFWGIGITISYGTSGGLVIEVHDGYSAKSSGIKPGDMIIKANGVEVKNDSLIKGDGPKKLVLTINRNGSTINIVVERCKVYY